MTSVGIVGGLGPESTIDYYRRILAAWERVDPSTAPRIVIDSLDVQKGIRLAGTDHVALAEYLHESTLRLFGAGVDFVVLAANTAHLVFDDLQARSPVPLLSIVEVCAEAAKRRGLTRLALLGTRFTMEAPFYPAVFERFGIRIVAPRDDERVWLHERYIGQLLKGDFRDETRQGVVALVRRLRDEERVDGVILGGTELPLLLRDEVVEGLPTLDTAALHVDAIVEWLRDGPPRRQTTASITFRSDGTSDVEYGYPRGVPEQVIARARDRRRQTSEAVASAVTTAQLLVGQADGMLAAWERVVESAERAPAPGAPTGPAPDQAPVDSAALLADLDHDLAELDAQVAALRQDAEQKSKEAAEWEERAAGGEWREDIARTQAQRRRETAAALAAEADALADMLDWYRGAVARLRAAAPERPGAS